MSYTHCGTVDGWKSHKAANEPMCRFCKRAKENPAPVVHEIKAPRAKSAECGTPQGYDRHRYLQEDICEPCRIAHNADRASYKRRKRAEKRALKEQAA